jgi:ribosome-associated heat shock protein Hsp15
VKPSREVYPTDKISLRKNQIEFQLTVLEIPDSRVAAKIVGLYRTDTTPAEAFEHQEAQRLAREYYRKKGTGRPTKKDRRNIDEYLDEGD